MPAVTHLPGPAQPSPVHMLKRTSCRAGALETWWLTREVAGETPAGGKEAGLGKAEADLGCFCMEHGDLS
jgi:hypothetical protein